MRFAGGCCKIANPKNNAQESGRRRSQNTSFAAGFGCWLPLFCAGCYCISIFQQPLQILEKAMPFYVNRKNVRFRFLTCTRCDKYGARRFPKGDRKALWSRPQARNPLQNKKVRKALFLPSTRNLFLVRGFARLRAAEVLSITGKYPKGAGGGQGVHASWPPPDPP